MSAATRSPGYIRCGPLAFPCVRLWSRASVRQPPGGGPPAWAGSLHHSLIYKKIKNQKTKGTLAGGQKRTKKAGHAKAPRVAAGADRELKAKLKKRKQRLHKVTADQLKEVGAPWVVTDDRGIVARGRRAAWQGRGLPAWLGYLRKD